MTTVTRVHHPIFTASDVARMPIPVRRMFADTAAAHAAARADFLKQQRIARREDFRAFLHLAADAMQDMIPA